MFIVLISMNTIGYYGILLIAKKCFIQQTLERIDEHANEMGGNLILKIPVGFAYLPEGRVYERTDGQFQYDGQEYRLVRQRIVNGVLYIVCIRDEKGTAINNLISDYSKTLTTESGQQSQSGKNFSPSVEFFDVVEQSSIEVLEGYLLFNNYGQHEDLYSYNAFSSVFHPPQYSV